MQKHIVMNVVRDYQTGLINEAKEIDIEIKRLSADSERLWKEVKRLTSMIDQLESISN